MVESTACNLCGSQKAHPIYELEDLMLAHPGTFQLVQCETCGLVFQNPRPTPAEMWTYYSDNYPSYDPGQKKANPYHLSLFERIGSGSRVKMVTRFKSGGKILDIGCSTGKFLRAMQAFSGWETWGIEPNQSSADEAETHGIRIIRGTFEQADLPEGAWDVITLWDVLEHLYDPRTALQRIRRLLKPGGILVIRVPNMESRDARLFGRAWAGLDAPRHLYVFRLSTLQTLLEKTGYRIISRNFRIGGYFNFLLSLKFWMVSQKWNPATCERLYSFFSSPLLHLLFTPYFFLRSSHERGPSITVTVVREGDL